MLSKLKSLQFHFLSKMYNSIAFYPAAVTLGFILLAILKKQGYLSVSTDYYYTIDYQTRSESATFLKNINAINLGAFTSPITQSQIDASWEAYISNHSKKDNVDNYHFFMAYQVISYWLAQLNDQQ